MKNIFAVILTFQSIFSFANMASPIIRGTSTATVISSKNIDILSEKLLIDISKDFSTAKYTVTYNISLDKSGIQIPLLFYAKQYKDAFEVFVDGKPVSLQPYSNKTNNSFLLGKKNDAIEEDNITIYWDEKVGNVISVNELKYFELNLSKGLHAITVVYLADSWVNKKQQIKTMFLPYALEPAKYWRSFGYLDIELRYKGDWSAIKTNYGNLLVVNDSAKKIHFDSLPGNLFNITYQPKLPVSLERNYNFWHSILPNILFFGMVLGHLFWLVKYRKANIDKIWNPVLLIGAIILPVAVIAMLIFTEIKAETVLGAYRGKPSGYGYFFLIFMYPVFLIMYLIIGWVIDFIAKKKFQKKINPPTQHT